MQGRQPLTQTASGDPSLAGQKARGDNFVPNFAKIHVACLPPARILGA